MLIKLVDFESSQIPDLNTSLDKPFLELQNATFTLKNGHSKLELWALKDLPKHLIFRKNRKAYAFGFVKNRGF